MNKYKIGDKIIYAKNPEEPYEYVGHREVIDNVNNTWITKHEIRNLKTKHIIEVKDTLLSVKQSAHEIEWAEIEEALASFEADDQIELNLEIEEETVYLNDHECVESEFPLQNRGDNNSHWTFCIKCGNFINKIS